MNQNIGIDKAVDLSENICGSPVLLQTLMSIIEAEQALRNFISLFRTTKLFVMDADLNLRKFQVCES